mmetsp:Transcript_60187/g.111587  ORF Transcript_60187/g.111587 Transcript_60187/m.111587 type:complete len:240 (-) Transcript_60187:39-758(-)
MGGNRNGCERRRSQRIADGRSCLKRRHPMPHTKVGLTREVVHMPRWRMHPGPEAKPVTATRMPQCSRSGWHAGMSRRQQRRGLLTRSHAHRTCRRRALGTSESAPTGQCRLRLRQLPGSGRALRAVNGAILDGSNSTGLGRTTQATGPDGGSLQTFGAEDTYVHCLLLDAAGLATSATMSIACPTRRIDTRLAGARTSSSRVIAARASGARMPTVMTSCGPRKSFRAGQGTRLCCALFH